MGIYLVTLCVDEMLSNRISEYLRDHWERVPCYRYVSGSSVELINDLWPVLGRGDCVVVLVESAMVAETRQIVDQAKIEHSLGEGAVRMGVLTTHGENIDRYSAPLYGPPGDILSLAYGLSAMSFDICGAIAVVYPAGRAAKLIGGDSPAKITASLGQEVTMICTDEYGCELDSQDKGDSFMRLMCHAHMGNIGDIQQYCHKVDGVWVLDAVGCAPELYELSEKLSQSLGEHICSTTPGVSLVILGSGACKLNLEIMRRCRTLICIGDIREMDRLLVRFFGSDVGEIYAKTVNIPVEEWTRCCACGEWRQLWQMI